MVFPDLTSENRRKTARCSNGDKNASFRGTALCARCRRAASKAAFSTFHIAAERGEHEEKEERVDGSSVESSRRRGGDGGDGGGDGDVQPRRGATVAVCTCSCLYAKRLDARSAAFLR